MIEWYQDLARSVDYLQERPEIDRDKLAYYTVSSHNTAAVNTALEDRFKAAVFCVCGLPRYPRPVAAVEAIDFAPRVHIPVLMINSRNDPFLQLRTSQRPLYGLLGTPQKDKDHLLYDVPGHGVPVDMFKEKMLSWLDRYLGKVPRRDEGTTR
jgi:hypothetical protein